MQLCGSMDIEPTWDSHPDTQEKNNFLAFKTAEV